MTRIKKFLAAALLSTATLSAQATVLSYNDAGVFNGLYTGLAIEDFEDITSASQLDSNTNITAGLTLSGPDIWYVANPGQSSNATKAAGTHQRRGNAIIMDFAGGVNAVSFELFQNDGGGSQFGGNRNALVRVFDISFNELAWFNLVTESGQANFMGIYSDVAIGKVLVNDAGSYDVIDNIQFSQAAVPAPASVVILAIGLLALGWRRSS